MAISSTGVGSGLDVNSIVSQLVAIEKQPLQALTTKATAFQTQLSSYGTIKSQVSALETASAALATSSGWAVQKATSSDATAVSVTASSAAAASVLSVNVTQLARAQSSASVGVAVGTTIGTVGTVGTLTIQMGSWVGSIFTGSGAAVTVDNIVAGDTVTDIKNKINAKYAGLTEGVTATVLKDGGTERLVVTSKNTGEAAGFHISAPLGTLLTKYGFENVAPISATTSTGVAPGSAATATDGTLSIRVGSWNDAAFAAGTSTAVAVPVVAGDTVAQIAAKINAAYGSSVATVDTSNGDDRLKFSYSGQGDAAGFRIDTLDADLFAYRLTAGSAASATRTNISQTAKNAMVNINGVDLTPASNTMADVSTGVTLKLNKIGTSEITIEQDKDAIQAKAQAFADAYTALSTTLTNATKYVEGGKSGPLQGDSTTVGIQTLLRRTLREVSGTDPNAKYLSDVGLELGKDKISLTLNTTKFKAAMGDMSNLQTLFTQTGTGQVDNGFGLKFKTFAHDLLYASSTASTGSSGTIVDKQAAINGAIKRNGQDQDRISERASRVEVALRKQYSALDAQMAKMNGLSSYVTAQLAQWNKTG
jgi:flagellar hook-associated protein 2